jgi:hypothetical protein
MDDENVVRLSLNRVMAGRRGGARRRPGALAHIALVFALTLFCLGGMPGCSKDSNPTSSQPGVTPASIALLNGGGQTAPTRGHVPTNPTFIVRDASGRPVQGAHVAFTVAGGGGSVASQQHTTGADGIATPGPWTMGSTLGANSLTAAVVGYPDLTATCDATARLPHWTFMVYMAADNTLAVPGINDIDEMEAAGFDADVQVVVQAEFSPTSLGQAGCDNPSCFNRPNWNTFRYGYNGVGAAVNGPNGSATDIGDRNMADPAQLGEFITWAKQNYAAEHTCLVLWNHGGGYTGLLEDQTTSPGHLMSVGDLPAALTAGGGVDVLDFDMCLMGGYETLALLAGHASYVVFSEEVVPGAGNPYTQILDAIQGSTMPDPRTVAEIIADRFNASYDGDRASTTISAFDMAGYAAFESALNAMASSFTAHLADVSAAISAAAPQTQHYTMAELKDLVHFLDTVRPQITDPTMQGQIDAVKAQVVGSFRLRNHARSGSGQGENDVSHSNGLSIVLPAGAPGDQFADQGPRSLTAYSAMYQGKAWTEFLTNWLNGTGQVPSDYVDQGAHRVETYLVWATAAIAQNVDIDMWVLEPNGELYIPYLGSVTPNGTFTNDSSYDQVSFEGYLTNRYVQVGEYKIYASLYSDPNSFRPQFDILYRTSQTENLASVYSPNFPALSMDNSWLNDPDATFERVDQDIYSDLRPAVMITVAPPGVPRIVTPGSAEGVSMRPGSGPTSRQLAKVRELSKAGLLVGRRSAAFKGVSSALSLTNARGW